MAFLHNQVFKGLCADFIVQALMGQIRTFDAKLRMSRIRAFWVLFGLGLYSDIQGLTQISLRYVNKKLLFQPFWSILGHFWPFLGPPGSILGAPNPCHGFKQVRLDAPIWF